MICEILHERSLSKNPRNNNAKNNKTINASNWILSEKAAPYIEDLSSKEKNPVLYDRKNKVNAYYGKILSKPNLNKVI